MTIAGEALAPMMQGLSRIVAKVRAPRRPDGTRAPLYLPADEHGPPRLLWELTDQEALALGSAVGAFGKYLPLSDQTSAITVDCARLAQVLVEVTQARLFIEKMHFTNEQIAAERAARGVSEPTNGAHDDSLAGDRRRNLSAI